CSTLLIAGAAHPLAPVAMAESLRGKIAGARLETVAAVGHWIPIEAPARSAELLSAHLDAQKM
ncbi:MAG: hypothetical protein WD489_10840, partial [Rhodovibrionaceae bacterium]